MCVTFHSKKESTPPTRPSLRALIQPIHVYPVPVGLEPPLEKEILVLKEFPGGRKVTRASEDSESSSELYLENRPCCHFEEESRGQGGSGAQTGLKM